MAAGRRATPRSPSAPAPSRWRSPAREIVRAPERGLLPTVAWRIGGETVYAVDGGVYDAGAAVEWAGTLGLFADLAELDAFAAPPAIGRGLAFVPALSGLACPHWDRSAAALWLGMSAGTSKRDLCQALLEGIALRTAEVVAAMGERVALGRQLSIDGGLARSTYFAQFLADVTGRTVVRPGFDELTAFGCAALAAARHRRRPWRSRTMAVPCSSRAARRRPAGASASAEAVTRARGWR